MNEITSERGDDSGIESSNADSGDNSIYIRVSIPEIKIQVRQLATHYISH